MRLSNSFKFKKLIAISLVLTMLLSLTSCDIHKKAREEVLSVTQTFADATKLANYTRFKRTISDDVSSKDMTKLQSICDYALEDSLYFDRYELIDGVLDATSYDIDPEDITFSNWGKEAVATIVFTLPDLEEISTNYDDTKDRTTLLEAFTSKDKTTEIAVEVALIKVEKNWKISEVTPAIDLLTDIMEAINGIHFHPDLDTAIKNISWPHSTNSRYFETPSLVFACNFDRDVEQDIIELITFKVFREFEDEPFYSGEYSNSSDFQYCVEVFASDTDYDDGSGCFLIGDYIFMLYDQDGEAFYSTSCSVLTDNTSIQEEPTVEDDDPQVDASSYNGISSGGVRYLERSGDFYDLTSPAVFCDVNTFSQVYSCEEGSEVIQFICESYGFNESVGYRWYYSETNNFADSELVLDGVCTLDSYLGRSFYLFELNSTSAGVSLPNGSYWCILSDAEFNLEYQVGYITVG